MNISMSKYVRSAVRFLLIICGATLATNAAANDQTPEDNTEVIEVVGETSLMYLRNKMKVAELDFYDSLNELIDEPKYKVRCRTDNITGSRLKQTFCVPYYIRNHTAQQSQDFLHEFNRKGYIPTYKGSEFLLRAEYQRAKEYVIKLVEKNPELLEKLVALEVAKQEYVNKKKQNK
ncbi:hypothetical protein [Thalassotalea agarivorans]|uniref:Uncharacterized protein n=1 Tax=Thalassotalea agarivorans TaxID=349064 RepID=A0A1H9ZZ12_THASX|nr:hypothetical protein [Thalassotalea agarivorans]SES86932.1 hypothetical protein SAMN05660429_00635 [Thalassotalea agarivorans]